MLEPWNNRSLIPPPVNTAISSEIDLKGLQHTLKNIITVLSKQSPLHKESAILSRLLYKYDKKFRHDIGYRYLKKVNCALRRYLLINLLKDIENFMSVLPDVEDTAYYVPTKQMFQYLLIRIISFSKLMFRIVVCSKQAATFYFDRLKRGESHWMSLMPYALLSRIWSMVYVLLQHSCTWYQLLHPFLDIMPFKGVNFLPDNYELPLNLGDWLEIKDINDFSHTEWTSKKTVHVDNLFISEDGDDDDIFENILQYVKQVNEKPKKLEKQSPGPLKNKINTPDLNVTVKPIDQGEAISRDTFKRLMNREPNNKDVNTKKDHYFHVIDHVTNKNTLQKFIQMEETFRNDSNKRSLTNHLSFMQWQSLKQSLLQLEDLTVNNRKLQRRFLKIWHEKCIDIE